MINMVSNIKEITECPDCGSTNLVYNEEKSQVICKDCGLIYEPLTPKEEKKYDLHYRKDTADIGIT